MNLPTNTTNYSLVKPATSDNADITVINNNMDAIDNQMKKNFDAISSAQTTANNAIPSSEKGVANGTATLDGTGNVPVGQLGNVPQPTNATESVNGLMSATDKTKLDGIESGAQVNPGDATDSTGGLMSSTDKIKLDSIERGAQVNSVTSVNSTSPDSNGNITLTPSTIGAMPAGPITWNQLEGI